MLSTLSLCVSHKLLRSYNIWTLPTTDTGTAPGAILRLIWWMRWLPLGNAHDTHGWCIQWLQQHFHHGVNRPYFYLMPWHHRHPPPRRRLHPPYPPGDHVNCIPPWEAQPTGLKHLMEVGFHRIQPSLSFLHFLSTAALLVTLPANTCRAARYHYCAARQVKLSGCSASRSCTSNKIWCKWLELYRWTNLAPDLTYVKDPITSTQIFME